MLIDTNFLNAFCHVENKENENLLKMPVVIDSESRNSPL